MSIMKEIEHCYDICLQLLDLETCRGRRACVFADFADFEFMDALKNEGKELVRLVKSGELNFDRVLKGKNNHAKAITQFLRRKGWSKKEVERAYSELHKAMNL